MRKISVEFLCTTPMFLGDANHQSTRIRESSFKGVLAFWWRALNAHKYFIDLSCLQKREQKLLGSQEGQGIFLLKISHEKASDLTNGTVKSFEPGTTYLAYGLKYKKNEIDKSALYAGNPFKFTVELVFKPNASIEDIKSVLAAVKVLGLVGGLGARTRRGWGSLSIQHIKSNVADIDNWSAPTDRTGYMEKLSELLKDTRSKNLSDLPLTAFGQETDIYVGTEIDLKALTAHNKVGVSLQKYRSFKGDKNFTDDHDWFYAVADKRVETLINGKDIDWLPERAIFGLPHNYYSKTGGKKRKVDVNYKKKGAQKPDRRASPIFIHVHECAKGFFPVFIHFKNLFLPVEDNQIYITQGSHKKFCPNHDHISRFLKQPYSKTEPLFK